MLLFPPATACQGTYLLTYQADTEYFEKRIHASAPENVINTYWGVPIWH